MPTASLCRPPQRLGAAGAQLAGWLALAAVNGAVITLFLPMPYGGLRVRLGHHLLDAGQLLAAGLCAHAIVWAWSRWGPRRAAWSFLAAWSFAALIALATLADDLGGLAEALWKSGPPDLLRASLAVGIAVAVPAAGLAGWLLARGALRLVAVALSVAAAVANHRLLQTGYPGVHLFAAWCSATLIGAALQGLPVPQAPWPVDPTRRRRAEIALHGAAVLAAAAALAGTPSSSVLLETFKLPGAVLAPYAVPLRVRREALAPAPADAPEWFVDRSNAPSVPPSAPRLMPDGGLVVLISVDALRADVIASEAHARLFPSLTSLRDASVQFTEARTTAPQTAPALASLFTGRYYSQLRWSEKLAGADRAKLWPHDDPAVRFPELLSKAKIDAVAFLGLASLKNGGIVRGFSEVIEPGWSSQKLVTAAIRRLARQGGAPGFLYMHLPEPHAPYAGAGTTPFERYLGEIATVDEQIGRLLRAIEERGLAGRTAVILTADHGEAFGEHGTYFHAVSVYDELVRVPLLMRIPGAAPRKVTEPVSLIDIGPTILDLLGQPAPGAFLGQSVTPYLRGEDPGLSRPLVVDSGRRAQAMVFPDGMKVIRDLRRGTIELYDLRADPGETRNLFDERADGRERLDRLRAFFQAHELQRPGYETPYRP